MKTIPFSMFSDYKESSLQALLDSFFVPKNPDVEHFLKENDCKDVKEKSKQVLPYTNEEDIIDKIVREYI